MIKKVRLFVVAVTMLLGMSLAVAPRALGQQTLGGVTGSVTDASGGVLPGTVVTLVGDETKLTRITKAGDSGDFAFSNLPIGTYTFTFAHDGFQTERIPSVLVQADRVATLNATLKVGSVGTTVTVEETPLMNAVDTTNGYVLDTAQLEAIPLPTGSFTGLAILSVGVNAELPSGAGVNTGLGNQPIWANGQRDTSNTFLLNGVDASNLFNGKSTSSVASGRIVNNTGVTNANNTTAEPVQTTASPYLAIGQALPSPAPETLQEVRVNTSMYDAQQGSTSGAHIDLSTTSGTNSIHGTAYLHRGTNAWNAAPYFYNQDPNIPDSEKVPGLHRVVGGGAVGGALIKDKLFGYISYQRMHVSDQEIGSSRIAVPYYLTDDRSPAGLASAIEQTTATSGCSAPPCPYFASTVNLSSGAMIGTGPGQINPIAYGLLNYKLPNGQYMIPSADGFTPSINFPENTFTLGTAEFHSDQAVANLDFIATPKDTLALKYYYQHDPTIAPYAYSGVAGFSQHLDAGSQVASITNTQTLSPTFNIAEVFGFVREKVYSTIQEPFTPASFATYLQNLLPGTSTADATINTFGSSFFPGITVADNFGNPSEFTNSYLYNTNDVFGASMSIGEGAVSQSANTGVFQNRFMPSANAIWTKGKHTVTFGGSFSYTQLNPRDNRTNKGMIGFNDFSDFLTGQNVTYNINGFIASSFLQGNAIRHYRSNETGEYVQDKYQFRSNLSLTFGLRYDYHGGLKEKDGELYNFEPSLYSYDAANDMITSNGFIIAGNNKQFASKGVSDSTLTGRQWGIAPRLGVAWSPKMFNNKVVVRAGWGLYYDRGELFTYLSPGFASGVIPGGPFGVVQSPPYVNSQSCSVYAYTTCAPFASSSACFSFSTVCGTGFENPWGTTLGPAPTGDPASLNIPNAATISGGIPLFSFAVYDRKNKLPYTMNQTLDIQWQPRNDIAIDIGYVGNLGRHEVVPIPFNEAQIATPSNPIRPGTPYEQDYTYGYTVVDAPGSFNPINLPSTSSSSSSGVPYAETFEGGNIDLRVPYIGYSAESESYTAAGISAYNAFQAHVEKRMSHGVQLGLSYTYSHALDEQSAMGLFYNGNNPMDLHSGYGNSDFDRTHVVTFSYLFRMHDYFSEASWQGKMADGWALEGLTVLQSGQPYSVIDYSGAVGSIYFGTSDGITNPIVPLAPGCTPKKALTGATGANGMPALDASCFTLPLLNPGDLNGAIPSNDPYETTFISNGQRNIFRQRWQSRADISIVKDTRLSERFSLKYLFEVFNLTNTPSFDIPVDNVTQNPSFSDFPYQGQPSSTSPCDTTFTALYVCPSLGGLGITNKTIGSSRQIQMSLSLKF